MSRKQIPTSFLLVLLSLSSCVTQRGDITTQDITTQAITTQETIETEKPAQLEVTHTSPTGSVEGRYETLKILVGFNQPMTPLEAICREETEGPLEITPPIKGKYRWLGTRMLAFIPSEDLPPATTYKVILKKEKIKSLTEMRLKEDISWEFEGVRPNLIASQPRHESTFIDLKSKIYLNFNLNMSPTKVGDKIKVFANYGKPSPLWCEGNIPPSPPKREEVPFKIRNCRDDERKDWPLKEWENKKTLVLIPKRPLPVESQIEVNIYPGLLAETGDLGTSLHRILTFNTYNRFILAGHSTEIQGGTSLDLCFSNPVLFNEVLKKIEIEPQVEIPKDLEGDYSSCNICLDLPFKVNSEYKIKIDDNLKDSFGNRLDKVYEWTLKVLDYPPHATIPTGINLLESKGSLRLPAFLTNVDMVHLEIGPVEPEEAIPFFLSQPNIFDPYVKYESPGLFKVSRPWKVNTYQEHKNKRMRLPIDLKEILGERKSGLVYVQLDNMGHNRNGYRYPKSFIQATDLGVTWKYSPENNLVWVTSLNSAEPIKDVRIQFRGDNNKVLAEGTTDDSGFCELKGWAETELKEKKDASEHENEYEMDSYHYWREPNFWILATKGEDSSIYSKGWNFGIDLWRFDIDYNWSVRACEYGLYIFTEKGLYRNGETVHIKGILRKKNRGRWVLPDLRELSFVVKNSRNEEVCKEMLQVNPMGAFFKDIPLPKDAPTGVYSITAILPDDHRFFHSFRVEAFKPAEFEVKVSSKKDVFLAKEPFEGGIQARYLFGMPMNGAELSWSLRQGCYFVEIPGYEGYTFANASNDKDDKKEILGSGKGHLDKDGKYEVRVNLSQKDITTSSIITLEGVITAPNKRTLAGRQNWVAYPSNLLVGLKNPKFLYFSGDTVEIDLVTVRPSGKSIGNKKVEVKVVKEEYRSIKKARLGGRYEWVCELFKKEVKRWSVTSKDRPCPLKFTPDEPGYYSLLTEVKDEKGRRSCSEVSFYVAGSGNAGWKMSDDDTIELVPDKKIYQVGDTAKILVKSPYDSATGLVTVERELVLRRYMEKLEGNADYIEIPIESSDLPNIYVCVTLVRGRMKGLSWDEAKKEDLGKPQFKIGYVNLMVDTKEKHLTVKTQSDKKEYRPGETITISYKVTDYKNRPVAKSEVALFAVDLGVLNLIDFRTPDPFDYFYASRPLSVKTVEGRIHILGERNFGEKGEERGGGGMYGGIKYREKFLTTAYYRGDLTTDEKGRGKVTFNLPDNLTKFRIMVVAQTKESEFGSGENNFVVNLPFILTDSLPRFARLHDRFTAGVVVHNRTNKEDIAEVKCEVEGLRIIDNDKKTQGLKIDIKKVVIPPLDSREVLFSFKAHDIGQAVFKFNAKMGQEEDALKLTIPVKSPPVTEVVATFSSIEDSALEGIIVPSKIYEDVGGLEILLSSTVLAGMQRGIEHLLEYPYGCLEQKLSRILPLMVGEDIINQFKLAPVTGKELREVVQKILDEVPQYQTQDGGFLYFKDSSIPCPYLSCYTMYLLKKAEENGYKIDPEMVKKGKGFLKGVLRWNDVDWKYPYNEYARLLTKSFCVYSLAIWEEKETGYASQLFERREQIPVFGKVLLLKAGRIMGMGGEFERELTRIITNKLKFSPTTAHFEESELKGWTFPSPAKVTGFVIQTFTELNIPFPYKDQVIRWLVQERTKKTKPTTHENAFVFDAFQTYYKRYEKEEPDFVARVILGEREILRETFKGRTNLPPQRSVFSLNDMERDKLLPVKISKEGKGRLYYTLRMTYAFKENPVALDEGFYIWKEVLTLDGKKVNKFKRGEVYKVILHIVIPETRIFAVVDDPLPAGFEPVQTSFVTESREIQERFQKEQGETKGHWWGSFDHEEYYDDRVLFFGQQLFPGEHTRVYFIKAGTSGRFLAPATKVEEMYQPEVFGLTGQNYMVISDQ